ncbi:MAG: hypothetical protein AAF962_14660 [Actinomycetota bacterium]
MHKIRAWKLNHEFVRYPAVSLLQDLDADQIAAHCADPGGHGSQSTRAVGQLNTDDVPGSTRHFHHADDANDEV